MYEALDISPGGEQYLPLAQHLMRRLHEVVKQCGLTHGRKHFLIPDGGEIQLRTRFDSGAWYDYIKIEVGGGGYILQLQLSSFGPEIGPGFSPYRVSMASNVAAFTPFLGYSYPPGVLPQIIGSRIIASGSLLAPFTRGYFDREKFTPFGVGGDPVIGAFRHKYTEEGIAKSKILSITSAGALVDTTTNATLSRSGATFSGAPSFLSYSVSADGRTALLEKEITFTATPVRQILKLQIDFVGDPQIVATDVAPTAPAEGYGQTIGSVAQQRSTSSADAFDYDTFGTFSLSSTTAATYPGVFGLGTTGEVEAIAFIQNDTLTIVGNDTAIDESSSGGDTSIHRTAPPSNGELDYSVDNAVLRTDVHLLTVMLPSGRTESFVLRSSRNEETVARSGHSGTSPTISKHAIKERTTEETALGILYADAAVPILFYVRHITAGTESSDHTAAENFALGTVPALGSVLRSREIGVITEAGKRVLFTEIATPVSYSTGGESFSSVKDGFVTFATQAFVLTAGLSCPPTAYSAASGSTDAVTTNLGYMKQHRAVTDFATDPVVFGPLNQGRLFVHDVSAGGFDPTKEPYYWIAVKDENTWIFGMRRTKDLDGNTINDLQLWSGNLDEIQLRQRYIDHLLAAGRSVDPPDETFLNTLLAGGFGAYNVGLAQQSRIPMV